MPDTIQEVFAIVALIPFIWIAYAIGWYSIGPAPQWASTTFGILTGILLAVAWMRMY